MSEVQKFTKGDVVVEAVRIEKPADLVEVRKMDWPEGQLALLSYPSGGVDGYVGVDLPLSAFGTRIVTGNWLVKGPAGDLRVMADGQFRQEFAEASA